MDTPLYTMRYTYGDTSWGDLLTAYDGVAITYDAIGNPLNDGTWTYTWERGRQLKSMSNGSTTWNMTYDADGLRTSRIARNSDGDITNKYYYYYENGLLTYMKYDSLVMRFTYDAQGRPVSMTHNGNTYYYALNLQGDVMALLDANGNEVVSYHYNAWGELLSTTGSLANTTGLYNPLRYRGYVYDRETGLYYVSSRYYNPEICRFISADDLDYLGADGSPISYNLYAYCLNNPVNRFDANGNWSMPNWLKVTVGVAAIAVLAVATVCTGGAAGVVAGAALSGAVAGGVSGAVTGAIEGGLSNGLQGAIDGACSGFMSGTLIGGATGAMTSAASIATGAVKVIGSAQKTGTLLHRAASNIEAGKMSLQAWHYSKITLNRSLNTAGLSGRRMPDVIGVTRKGTSTLIEVVSKSQTNDQMIKKCISMCRANPGSSYKVIGWAASVSRLFR